MPTFYHFTRHSRCHPKFIWYRPGLILEISPVLIQSFEVFGLSSAQEPSISPELRSTYLAFDEAETIHGIASGLAYLHEAHVIHGDLKASNVLLDDSVTPMICDFGLTKNDQFHTTSDTMKGAGTVRWMCPSLMDGAPRSKKTDIYAFGMTIVESLSGVLFAVSEGRRPPFEPSARNDRDFKPLWDLAASCWQTQPAVRPGSYEILGRLADLALNTRRRRVPTANKSRDRSNSTALRSQSHEVIGEESRVSSPPMLTFHLPISIATSKLGKDPVREFLPTDQGSETVCVQLLDRPVTLGNCDLFKGLHLSTQTVLAMKRPRILGFGDTAKIKEAQRVCTVVTLGITFMRH
ncbi:hypothetical protein FRB94_011154 [Tulasnella sp. JGI-2019a]|nr:hypothetical protein FRB94_011154 [Tulasnella sp. JGI-2019a]